MPISAFLAHRLVKKLAEVRKTGALTSLKTGREKSGYR